MLKGTYHSKYIKAGTGSEVFKYTVTGPKAELDDYMVIMASRQGKTVDDLAKADGTNLPLHFVNKTAAKRQGRTLGPTINLVKNFANDNYFIDTSAADLAREARIDSHAEVAEGQIMAEIRMGIRTVGQPTRNIQAPVNQPAVAEVEAPDALSEATARIGEAQVAGNETLAQ